MAIASLIQYPATGCVL